MAEQENEKLWHVIYTKSKWEKKVDSLLLQRGFESWCPVQKKERQWSDRKKIIEEHEGLITIENIKNSGALINIQLPISKNK
ncbi:MAG: hypothetical protein RLZ31_269 [Pseudomonadota bacterium]